MKMNNRGNVLFGILVSLAVFMLFSITLMGFAQQMAIQNNKTIDSPYNTTFDKVSEFNSLKDQIASSSSTGSNDTSITDRTKQLVSNAWDTVTLIPKSISMVYSFLNDITGILHIDPIFMTIGIAILALAIGLTIVLLFLRFM